MTTPNGPGSGEPPRDLTGLFDRIPQVDAVKRPHGMVGWRPWHAMVGLVLGAGLFWLLGGPTYALGAWSLGLAATALLSGFVWASYLPRRGRPFSWKSCDLLPLALSALALTVLNPATPMTGVVAGILVVVAAVRRASSPAC